MRPLHVVVVLAAGVAGARLFWPATAPSPSKPAPAAAETATAAPQQRSTLAFDDSVDTTSRPPRAARAEHRMESAAAKPHETPVEMRTRVTAKLVASGDAPAPFHADVEDVVEGWQRDLSSSLREHTEFGPVSCHRDGCAVEIISDDALSHEESSAALANAPAFIDYAGWRMRSGDETDAGGRIHATWFFLAPA